jgi:hypothetical protein
MVFALHGKKKIERKIGSMAGVFNSFLFGFGCGTQDGLY